MEFTGDRDAILGALSTAQRAAMSARYGIPKLRLEIIDNDGLAVFGMDEDLIIAATCDITDVSGGQPVNLPARLLVDIMRTMDPDSKVHFVAGNEGMIVSEGTTEFIIRYVTNASESALGMVVFPRDGEKAVALPALALEDALRQIVPAAATDTSRPQLTGVYFVQRDTGLRMVATDGYRMALRDLPGLDALPEDEGVLIPARSLGEVRRLIDVGDGDVDFSHNDRMASFTLLSVGEVTTRLISAPFPTNYEKFFPTDPLYSFTVDKEAFETALRRARLLLSTVATGTIIKTLVRIIFDCDAALMTVAQNADVGHFEATVEGEYEGKTLTIGFNPNYMLAGLEAIKAERVTLEMTHPEKPGLLKAEGDENFQYSIMPTKL